MIAYDSDPNEKSPLLASRTVSFSEDQEPIVRETTIESLKKSSESRSFMMCKLHLAVLSVLLSIDFDISIHIYHLYCVFLLT